jgi:hypothetical protein
MKKALFCALAGAAMLSLAGAASAQPLQLTNAQLDRVTAGATSLSTFTGVVSGNISAALVLLSTNTVAGTTASAISSITGAAASTVPGIGASAADTLTVTLTSP